MFVELRTMQTRPLTSLLSRKATPTVLIVLLLVGCAKSLPTDYPRTPSTAITSPESTELGRFFQSEIEAHPLKSGVALIPSGREGFRSRVGLANVAEKTLDVQYYIWESDTVGKVLAERVLRAADRGVRVRMLIDDISTKDTTLVLPGWILIRTSKYVCLIHSLTEMADYSSLQLISVASIIACTTRHSLLTMR